MKFGVHLALWARQWDDDVIPYAERAADLGFDGVELSLLGMTSDRMLQTMKSNNVSEGKMQQLS